VAPESQFHASDAETVLDDRRAEEDQNDASASLLAPDVLAHWIPVLLGELDNMPLSTRKFLLTSHCIRFLLNTRPAEASSGSECTPPPKETCENESNHSMNPEHVHLLATKWLDPKELSILAEREGLKYKKGKFSLGEQRSIHSALEAYKIVCLYTSPNALHLNVCVRGPRKRLPKSNRCSSRVMTKVATRCFGLNWVSETLA